MRINQIGTLIVDLIYIEPDSFDAAFRITNKVNYNLIVCYN